MIPFLKTDQSIGKSIIQLTGRKQESDFPTVVSIVEENDLKRVYMVEDNLSGFISSYKELKKKGVQLCFGWRVSFVSDLTIKEDQSPHKLIIFIKSERAYKKLIKLVSTAQTVGDFKGTARLDFDTLHKHWDDEFLIAVPFYDSFLSVNLLTRNIAIPDFRQIKPYVFLESNDMPFDALIREAAERFAAENGLITVEGKSIYYDRRDELKAFQVKKIISKRSFGGGTLEEPNLDYFSSAEFCMESWRDAEKVECPEFEREFDEPLELFLPGVRLPEFKLSKERQERYGLDENTKPEDILRAIARDGMKEMIKQGLIPKDKVKDYSERAKSELDILIKTRLFSYILIVWGVTDFIKQQGYAQTPGRGSAAGSLINWLIGITGKRVDPFVYDLFFQRFVSENRTGFVEIDGATYLTGSPADIDIDLSSEERHFVFEYVQREYPNRTSKVATLGTLTSKKLVTEVCKILLNYTPEQAKLVSDLIPLKFNQPLSVRDSYNESEDFKNFCDKNPEFLEICCKLYDSISSFGKHASAVLLSYEELDNFMPLQLDSDGDLISSYDQNVVMEMTTKLDLLGLASSAVIHNTCKSVGMEPDEIPLDSQEFIYQPAQNLEYPYGLFQMGGAVQIATRQIKPDSLEELSDCLAIGRPGAAQFIPKYAEGKSGEVQSLHPLFDPFLKKTGNTVLYQEQTLQCLNAIGFTLLEAEDARRAIGKKQRDQMILWEERIYKKAEENNIDPAAAKILWDVCNASADYSFNKSHSIAYSVLAAQTIYLKHKYPQHFFLESLKVERNKSDFYDKVGQIITELPAFNIKLLAPSIAKSGLDFKLEGGNIIFGLNSIKGASSAAAQKIQKFIDTERGNKFQVFDAAKISKVDARVFSALASVGALEEYEKDRNKITLEYRIWNLFTEKERNYCLHNGQKYKYDLIAALKDYNNWVSSDGKKVTKESRLETIRSKSKPYIQIFRENSEKPEITRYLFEKELLGFSFSHTLSSLFKEHGQLQKVSRVLESPERAPIKMVGHILDVVIGLTKKSQRKIKLLIGDETGSVNVLMLGDKADNYLATFKDPKKELTESKIVVIRGTKASDDLVWGEQIQIQELSVYSRVSDLRRLAQKEE